MAAPFDPPFTFGTAMAPLVVPVPYETFTNSPSALNNAGGHWFYEAQWPTMTRMSYQALSCRVSYVI